MRGQEVRSRDRQKDIRTQEKDPGWISRRRDGRSGRLVGTVRKKSLPQGPGSWSQKQQKTDDAGQYRYRPGKRSTEGGGSV